MELQDLTWQQSPRFVVTGDKQRLQGFINKALELGYTADEITGNKVLVHLLHISDGNTIPTNGRLQEMDAGYEYIDEHLLVHQQFTKDILADNVTTIEFKSTGGIYPVLINKYGFMVEGLIYSKEFLREMMEFYEKAPGAITNEPIVLLKDVKCFRIGCVDVSYNDGVSLLQAINNIS